MGYYHFDGSGLEMGQLEEFSAELEQLLHDMPQMRRELHEDLAAEMKRALDVRIDSSLNDSSGHVKSWQVPQVGSGGGYAAVRPTKNYAALGKNSPAAITAALEGGHKPSWPQDRHSSDYYPRVKFAYINGRWFYRNTYITFEQHAIRRAEKFVNQLADRLEGVK